MNKPIGKKLVIVGAGFAGIELAKGLVNSGYEVLVLDKQNYHTFQPLLYQVATGGLEPDSIAYPVRRILRGARNVRFQMANVVKIDAEKNLIETSMGSVSYDILVLATGTTNDFFNCDDVKSLLLPLKSVTDALDFRSKLMQNMEKAVASYDEKEKQSLINIGIVGGGPSGVELAGALAEMRNHVLKKDFPRVDISKMQIGLFEAYPRLISVMSEKASEKALDYLSAMGVKVRLNAKVSDYDGSVLTLENGEIFSTDSVVWTAGVRGFVPGDFAESAEIAGNNRLRTDDWFKVNGFENIYAIGDIAVNAVERNFSEGHPQLATAALQQGEYMAKYFLAKEKGKAMERFQFRDLGNMATVGRNKAVLDWKYGFLKGSPAWFVWMFVHIVSLVGFRNKLVALIDWVYNYFSYDRPLGLIIRPYNHLDSTHPLNSARTIDKPSKAQIGGKDE